VIRLYPLKTETLVLPFDQSEVAQRIERVLNQPFVLEGFHKVVQGSVDNDAFKLSIRTRRHEFFMPLVQGTMEPTSKGSLVFVTYSLFPGTKALLTFGTLFLPLLALPWYLESKNPWVFAALSGLAVLIHVIARANFALHQKTARKIINNLLA
jgi:hypothetical protein